MCMCVSVCVCVCGSFIALPMTAYNMIHIYLTIILIGDKIIIPLCFFVYRLLWRLLHSDLPAVDNNNTLNVLNKIIPGGSMSLLPVGWRCVWWWGIRIACTRILAGESSCSSAATTVR